MIAKRVCVKVDLIISIFILCRKTYIYRIWPILSIQGVIFVAQKTQDHHAWCRRAVQFSPFVLLCMEKRTKSLI